MSRGPIIDQGKINRQAMDAEDLALRNEFAKAALIGILSDTGVTGDEPALATFAFEIADKMLVEARRRPNPVKRDATGAITFPKLPYCVHGYYIGQCCETEAKP